MKVVAADGLEMVEHGGIGGEALGPPDMGEVRMHTVGEPGHQRDGAGALHRIRRHQVRRVLRRDVVEDRGVLDDRAFVDHQRRHAAARIDLEIFRRALLALGEGQGLRLVGRAAFLQADVGGRRAGAGCEVELEHVSLGIVRVAWSRRPAGCGAGTRGRSSRASRRRTRRCRRWRRSPTSWTAGTSPIRPRRSAPWPRP